MKYPAAGELPAELEPVYRKALLVEWITLGYMLTAVTVVFFALGDSQAMKGAWLEDMLSFAPPIAFLVASRVRHRKPNAEHRFGYHRAVELAYLVASLSLFALGLYLVVDSTLKLLSGDHPPIGMVELFDWQVWLGWLMIAALLYSAVPVVILGRIKTKLAAQLHDKVLYADAQMNQADWMTAGAAIIGVIGIGFGVWWLDAAAAIVIGVDVLHDGVRYMRAAAKDILDGVPRKHDESGVHPLVGRVEREVAGLDWVEEAAVRIRELGHVVCVEVLAVPRDDDDLTGRVEDAVARIVDLDWKVQDVVVTAVRSIDDAPEEVPLLRPG